MPFVDCHDTRAAPPKIFLQGEPCPSYLAMAGRWAQLARQFMAPGQACRAERVPLGEKVTYSLALGLLLAFRVVAWMMGDRGAGTEVADR